MPLIRLDFIDTMLQVAKLKAAREDCEDAIEAAKRARNMVTEIWSGEAQQAFLDKIDYWESQMVILDGQIDSLINQITRVAKDIKEADEAAALAAEELPGGVDS